MYTKQDVATNFSPHDLIGKEVTVTHAEKEFIFPIREFVLKVTPIPEEDDFEVLIGIKSRRKNDKYSGYKCRYSEVIVVPLEQGKTVDFENEEIQRLIKRLN